PPPPPPNGTPGGCAQWNRWPYGLWNWSVTVCTSQGCTWVAGEDHRRWGRDSIRLPARSRARRATCCTARSHEVCPGGGAEAASGGGSWGGVLGPVLLSRVGVGVVWPVISDIREGIRSGLDRANRVAIHCSSSSGSGASSGLNPFSRRTA